MPKLLTTEDLARLLKITPETIRAHRATEARNPALRHTLLPRGLRLTDNGPWRYRLDDVEAWLDKRANEAFASANANEGAQA